MLKIDNKLWDEISGFEFDNFESVKRRFNEYENIISELHCCGVIEDEWEKLEEKLLYGFILCCCEEIYCNKGRFGDDINNVVSFCLDGVKKMKFSLGDMMLDCQIYELVILIKDIWDRYRFELKRDLEKVWEKQINCLM